MCCGLPTKLVLKGNGAGGKGFLLPLLTHTNWHDKRKDIKHLKAPPPQGHANVFVLILSIFFFFVKFKEFYALFVSVWTPMETKGAASKSIYLLYDPPRTNAAFTHMQCCRFKEGLCSWCCSTSNGKHVFLATNMCVVCCGTKIAGSCCTLVSHSFLHLVCKVKVVRAVWNGIFIHRLGLQRPHGKGKGAEKLILEHPRSMKHVRRHSLHRHWHTLIHSVLSSVHRTLHNWCQRL